MIETVAAVASNAATAVGKRLAVGSVSDAVQGNEVLADGDALKLAALPMVDSLGLRLDVLVNNPVLHEHYAGFLNGLSSGANNVVEHAHAIGVRVSTPLGHFDVSLEDDSILGHLHLNEAIAHSFEPSIRAFEQLRLDQLNRPTTVEKLNSFVDSHLPAGMLALFVPFGDVKRLAEFEQSCLRLLDDHGILVTAKRVDYLFGSQYIEGTAVNFPLIGGFANIIYKAELGIDVAAEDWVKLGSDAFLIACIALVPVGGSVAAIAASGAVIGGVHSGLTQGALSYLRTGDAAQALHSAGRASIEGAAIGAVGGAVAGKALQSLGTGFRSLITTSSLAGGATGATDATFRVLHDGASVSEAVSDILASAGKGALAGGALGGVHYGVSRMAGRLETIAQTNVQLRRDALDRFLAVEKSADARFDACLKHALDGPYLQSFPEGYRYKVVSWAKSLRGVDGVERTLKTIGSEGANKAAGDCHTLCRAAHWQATGREVAALNKPVFLPLTGKTDIDILFRDGTWIEAKRVGRLSAPHGIACDEKFRSQISKMEEAVKSGLKVIVDGEPLAIQRAIYMNRGAISSQALDYARSHGIQIYENQPFTKVIQAAAQLPGSV